MSGMDAAVAIRRPSSKTSSKNKGGWFERPVLLRIQAAFFAGSEKAGRGGSLYQWAEFQDAKKRGRGDEPGLNRVPCPEAAVRQLMDGAERASGKQLGWAALLLVQLLCWMRADSCAGFQDNDIVVSQDGRVSVSIRYITPNSGGGNPSIMAGAIPTRPLLTANSTDA